MCHLLLSECGGSPSQLAQMWTPRQMLEMAAEIRRSRNLREAEQMELHYITLAAAQGGKGARERFAHFRKVVRELRAGVEKDGAPRGGLAEIAKRMGLPRR